ncbi:MAG: Txe/YoeB family addiction module toxin [Gracilibacteraceae bacterium]|jgi:Txe/YoeB family toxin of toxin-antitoxin system|nr:Txe/YoeB family addiction module toxin [Gracilibacteraceae bacterium]
MYDIRLTKQAQKDAVKVERTGLKLKTVEVIKTIRNNPFEESQDFEKLKGDLKGAYSRRINRQHRFVYEVLPNDTNAKDANGKPYDGIVKVISMWTHYE